MSRSRGQSAFVEKGNGKAYYKVTDKRTVNGQEWVKVNIFRKRPDVDLKMAVTHKLQSKASKKFVLQQSNCNLGVLHDREEDFKLEKTANVVKMKEDVAPETENQCTPLKVDASPSGDPADNSAVKSDAKKLRSIRLDLSSLKRGVIQKAKANGSSSGESSEEDEARNKKNPRPVVPNYVTNTESGPCRKPRQSRKDSLQFSSQMSPRVASQSLSIARRNARERNRVKQVNEGFATLRNRIPDYISEAYNEEKGRKTAKKLSKVETLRMAVDYIRHLETLLDLKSTEKNVWMKQVKVDHRPWGTPDSGDYLSPKYQPPCVDSPGPGFDQTFEYQDRVFYDYDLDFIPRKEPIPSEKKLASFTALSLNGNESENQCVEDFKYYETFNRIKKIERENASEDGGLEEVELGVEEEEVEEDPEGEEIEGGDIPEGSPQASDPQSLPKDVINEAPKKSANVLPSITESFNKTIPVFF